MIFNQPIVHIDCETGGLKPHRHPTLSIAAFLMDTDGSVITEFSKRCRLTPKHEQEPDHPQRFLSCDEEALKVNGLDPNEGLDEPDFYAEFTGFLATVKEHTGTKPYLSAFNAQFDYGFVQALVSRHSKAPFAMLNLVHVPFICTMQLMSLHCIRHGIDRSTIRKPSSNRASFSLPAIYYYLFKEVIDPKATHDASIDALMSARIFNYLINHDHARFSCPVI